MTLGLALALTAQLAPLSIAWAAPSFPPPNGTHVVDEANILSPATEAKLNDELTALEDRTQHQVVVATVSSLQGLEIEDYGYQLGRTWGIGRKDVNDGVVLLVAPNERKVRIEVGYGLEPIMTDALSSQIINETIVPKFKAGDMPGGIVAGAQAIAEQMKLPLEAAEQRAQQQQTKVTQNRQRSHGGGFPFGLLFWGIVFVFVILPMLGLGRRSRRGPWGKRYRNDDGALPIILWSIANEIGRSSSHGGGSWGGSGGGGWGGGGGGGFSGGGGSFGGGGASGSW